jgi:hypothetical protein
MTWCRYLVAREEGEGDLGDLGEGPRRVGRREIRLAGFHLGRGQDRVRLRLLLLLLLLLHQRVRLHLHLHRRRRMICWDCFRFGFQVFCSCVWT